MMTSLLNNNNNTLENEAKYQIEHIKKERQENDIQCCNHDDPCCTDDDDNLSWVHVINKRRNQKINLPCWFFNNGGCRHKDGSLKTEKDCKYLHVYSNNVQRPPHLISGRPCDKYNLEGTCRWNDQCKYSHRILSEDEWKQFYPSIPYVLRFHIHRQKYLETVIEELQSKINILEFKLNSMDNYFEEKINQLE